MSQQKNAYLDDKAEQALEELKQHFADKSDSEIIQDAIKTYSEERDVGREIRRRKRRIRNLEDEVDEIKQRIENEKDLLENARHRRQLAEKFKRENQEEREKQIEHQVKDLARVAREKDWQTVKQAVQYRRCTSSEWEYEPVSEEKLLSMIADRVGRGENDD